ncbi:hypothetical protein GLS40_06250 [Pseudooceanicola sp. 216_PA32_1]|uniref:Uncharacterized protein n=1 Tax=Pseudooceanicola pacificus TaxID=2676438 RepID=A0A844WAF7_9RHOB|nr:KTSC domain-containing protein [Pseudooceanicola pacificus]MWB77618.1 hypothetical protein [Pseudooceanicola pacificus]
MPHVDSSAIPRLDGENGRLSIRFHETGRHDENGVAGNVHAAALVARPKGAFFNQRIRANCQGQALFILLRRFDGFPL